jgi:hypothetical protein
MQPSTQSVYRNIMNRFCEEAGASGIVYGVRRQDVVTLMAARSTKPDSANGLRQVLRTMMAHAVESEMRKDDPTRDVKPIKRRSDGFHSWTEDEIVQVEMRHPIGSKARLDFALLLYRASAVATLSPWAVSISATASLTSASRRPAPSWIFPSCLAVALRMGAGLRLGCEGERAPSGRNVGSDSSPPANCRTLYS